MRWDLRSLSLRCFGCRPAGPTHGTFVHDEGCLTPGMNPCLMQRLLFRTRNRFHFCASRLRNSLPGWLFRLLTGSCSQEFVCIYYGRPFTSGEMRKRRIRTLPYGPTLRRPGRDTAGGRHSIRSLRLSPRPWPTSLSVQSQPTKVRRRNGCVYGQSSTIRISQNSLRIFSPESTLWKDRGHHDERYHKIRRRPHVLSVPTFSVVDAYGVIGRRGIREAKFPLLHIVAGTSSGNSPRASKQTRRKGTTGSCNVLSALNAKHQENCALLLVVFALVGERVGKTGGVRRLEIIILWVRHLHMGVASHIAALGIETLLKPWAP